MASITPMTKRIKVEETFSEEKFIISYEELGDVSCFRNSDFEMICDSSWYVDKTMFIKSVLEQKDFAMIRAPRQFMKTANMNMLKKFIQIKTDINGEPIYIKKDGSGKSYKNKTQPNFHLFKNKKIYQEHKFFYQHFGQYPVIHIDFKYVCGDDFKSYLETFKVAINKSFKEHQYLLKSGKLDCHMKPLFKLYHNTWTLENLDVSTISRSLAHLGTILHQHFDRDVFLLVDEIDAPVFRALNQSEFSIDELQKLIGFIRDLLGGPLSRKKNIHQGLINSCYHVERSLFEQEEIVTIYPFLHDTFCEFYGFTEDEVDKLVGSTDSKVRKQIKDWYNGYTATNPSGRTIRIYNNWSVLNCLKEKKITNYWAANELSIYRKIMLHHKIAFVIRQLMSGATIEIQHTTTLHSRISALTQMLRSPKELKRCKIHLFLEFLYELGYFNGKYNLTTGNYHINIPNDEIRYEFWFNLFSLSNVRRQCKFKILPIELIQVSLEEILHEKYENSLVNFTNLSNAINLLYCGKNIRLPDRDFEFQAHLYYIMLDAHSKTRRNYSRSFTGEVRCNIVLIVEEHNSEMVFEVRVDDDFESKDILLQILDNRYDKSITIKREREMKNKFLVAIHFNKFNRKVSITYLIKILGRDLGYRGAVQSHDNNL